MDILVRAKVHIFRRWVRPAEVVTSPNKPMAVMRRLPPNEGAHRGRGRCELCRRARHWLEDSVGTDGEFLGHHWSPLYENQGTHHNPDWLVRVFPMTHMSHFISDMLVIRPTLRTFYYWTFPHPMTHPYLYDIILLLWLLIPPHDVINDSWPFIAIGCSHAHD